MKKSKKALVGIFGVLLLVSLTLVYAHGSNQNTETRYSFGDEGKFTFDDIENMRQDVTRKYNSRDYNDMMSGFDYDAGYMVGESGSQEYMDDMMDEFDYDAGYVDDMHSSSTGLRRGMMG